MQAEASGASAGAPEVQVSVGPMSLAGSEAFEVLLTEGAEHDLEETSMTTSQSLAVWPIQTMCWIA